MPAKPRRKPRRVDAALLRRWAAWLERRSLDAADVRYLAVELPQLLRAVARGR